MNDKLKRMAGIKDCAVVYPGSISPEIEVVAEDGTSVKKKLSDDKPISNNQLIHERVMFEE